MGCVKITFSHSLFEMVLEQGPYLSYPVESAPNTRFRYNDLGALECGKLPVIPFSDTIDFVSSGSDARREICY